MFFTANASGFQRVEPSALSHLIRRFNMLYAIFLGVLVYLGVAHDVSPYLLLVAGFLGGFTYVVSSYAQKPAGYNKDIRKWG